MRPITSGRNVGGLALAAAVAAMVATAMPGATMGSGVAKDKKKAKADKSIMPRVEAILRKTDKKLGKAEIDLPSLPTPPDGAEKSVAPYFFVPGADPAADVLPLKETSARIMISGPIAGVEIRQVFGNSGDVPIEAVYVFPASTRASVHGMKMKIGDRVIEAEIEKREQAKETYEAAKSAGKKASLLEQERPNVFSMRVANIMPGDEIEVTVSYTEMIVPEGGVYELVYPAVVGPRYGGGADATADDWISTPYTEEGEPATYSWSVEADIESALPISGLESPSHAVDVTWRSARAAIVQPTEPGGGDRDFVLRWKLAGDAVDGGALLYDHGDEKFFAVMIEPPAAPTGDDVLPREFVFLVDVSGSMSGYPLDTARALIREILGNLEPTDRFDVVTFAGNTGVLSEKSVPATAENVDDALERLSGLSGGGGTELVDGLKRAYAVPAPEDDSVSRTVVVITDGYVGVEAQAFKYIRNRLDEANLFAFGIGTSVNRYLIEGMARAGAGEPFVILDPSKADGEAKRFSRYVRAPILADIEVGFEGIEAYDVAPQEIPDLMAERPIVVFGKIKGEALGKITIEGRTAGGAWKKSIEVSPDMVAKESAPIRHLWVRKWVDILGDQLCMLPGNSSLEKAVTRLGLHYSILTAFTSFVAVDRAPSNETGKLETVKQPLPLPAGVSNLAVGDSSKVSSGGLGGYGVSGTGGGGAGYGGMASYSTSCKGAAVPQIAMGSASVSGSLSTDSIKKILQAAVKADPALKLLPGQCPGVEVQMKLKIAFGADGSVDSVDVVVTGGKEACADAEAAAESLVKTVKNKLATMDTSSLASTIVTYPVKIAP